MDAQKRGGVSILGIASSAIDKRMEDWQAHHADNCVWSELPAQKSQLALSKFPRSWQQLNHRQYCICPICNHLQSSTLVMKDCLLSEARYFPGKSIPRRCV